jgi:hypothetical protein
MESRMDSLPDLQEVWEELVLSDAEELEKLQRRLWGLADEQQRRFHELLEEKWVDLWTTAFSQTASGEKNRSALRAALKKAVTESIDGAESFRCDPIPQIRGTPCRHS